MPESNYGPNLHITVEVPANATAAEQRDLIAAAVDTGIRHAAFSPDFRLKMILGEAWARFEGLAQWVAQQLEKDESTAPGLIAHAQNLFPGGTSRTVRGIGKEAILVTARGYLRPEKSECLKITAPAIPGTD